MTTKTTGRPRKGKSFGDFEGKKALKIEIARQIAAHLRQNEMTQTTASIKFGIDPGIMSHICNANLDAFTVDRLIGIAETIGVVVKVNFGE